MPFRLVRCCLWILFQVIGKRVRHRWEDQMDGSKWYEGRVINIIRGSGEKGGNVIYGIV